MSFRRRMKGKRPPEGWDLIESSIEDFESQMRDAVAEEHEGKRKNELVAHPPRALGEEPLSV